MESKCQRVYMELRRNLCASWWNIYQRVYQSDNIAFYFLWNKLA